MKRFKFSAWKRVAFLICVSLLILFFVNIRTANAMLTDLHTFYVMWRFEKEVLRSTRLGQYYDGLIIRNSCDAMSVMAEHPESQDRLRRLADAAIPLIESYLNGEGDTTIITAEQMDLLKGELDWFHSLGSPSLQKAIEQELERFPLDQFIGMSVTEAYAHALASFDGALPEPDLVIGTNGEWAYYTFRGIYFEYPSAWYAQELEAGSDGIIIIPSAENLEGWQAGHVVVEIRDNITPDGARQLSVRSESCGCILLWEQPVEVGELAGYDFAFQDPQKILVALGSELYSEQRQMYIAITVIFLDPLGIQFDSDPEAIQKRHEYFFHIVDSLRILQP